MHPVLFWIRLVLLFSLLLAFVTLLVQGVVNEHRDAGQGLSPLQPGADPGIRVLLRSRTQAGDGDDSGNVHESVALVVLQAAHLFTPDNITNPDWQLSLDPQSRISIMPHPTGGFRISSTGASVDWPVDRLRLQAQHLTDDAEAIRTPFNRNPRRFEAADRKPVVAIADRRYRGSLDLKRLSARKLRLINSLPMEAYVAGVVPAEMSPSWPLEALKSQAICARSYAFAKTVERAGRDFDVVDTVLDQAYHGHAGGSTTVSVACQETAGTILSYRDMTFTPFFCASSGGRTAAVDQVFSRARASDGQTPLSAVMPSVVDPYCQEGAQLLNKMTSHWQSTLALPSGQIRGAIMARNTADGIERPVGFTQDLRVLERVNGRVTRVVVDTDGEDFPFTGEAFRRLIGARTIHSTLWSEDSPLPPSPRQDHYTIVSYGYGHGVGLSQISAYAMAQRHGFSCEEILRFFYPEATLVCLW
jgi:SpoIID/LytB domain protein